jgi:hypothetical protein
LLALICKAGKLNAPTERMVVPADVDIFRDQTRSKRSAKPCYHREAQGWKKSRPQSRGVLGNVGLTKTTQIEKTVQIQRMIHYVR